MHPEEKSACFINTSQTQEKCGKKATSKNKFIVAIVVVYYHCGFLTRQEWLYR